MIRSDGTYDWKWPWTFPRSGNEYRLNGPELVYTDGQECYVALVDNKTNMKQIMIFSDGQVRKYIYTMHPYVVTNPYKIVKGEIIS